MINQPKTKKDTTINKKNITSSIGGPRPKSPMTNACTGGGHPPPRRQQRMQMIVNAARPETPPSPEAKSTRQGCSNTPPIYRELPFLFAKTPGIIAWGENGIGSGTSYMRIRGAGDSRINVTLDGVSLNSPEDQCVFWANMNSYGSLLSSVQIQRGVGSSTNGDGAFGGTISLTSAKPSFVPSAEITGSYGSFNTLNFGAKASTGLLWNHLIVDGAYHETHTDGFIHGTKGRSGSYYGGLTWMGKNFIIRYKNIGNFEMTGQAWNGVTAGNNDLSLMDGTYGIHTGIKTYADMYKVGWDSSTRSTNTSSPTRTATSSRTRTATT